MTIPTKTILDPADVSTITADPSVLGIMTRQQAQDFGICVFSKDGRKLYAITTNEFPNKVASFSATQSASWYSIQYFYTSQEWFLVCLGRYDTVQQQQQAKLLERQAQLNAQGQTAITTIKELYEKREGWNTSDWIMEVVRLGYQAGASDVHFQAHDDGVLLRLRIDGVLHPILHIPHDIYFPYGKKLKFIAGTKMNIDHLPQDGRFGIQAKNKHGILTNIDVRASFMPGIGSDNTVLRFLDSSQGIMTFEQLGLWSEAMTVFRTNIARANWLILITWPTWSWKTTTLYSILGHKNTWQSKIITLEDPIEYQIPGIQQSQINYTKGYDYETGLKACMRQDPDVILLGETRTPETAQTVVTAALTGHLCFTTLHTNSALDAIPRMLSLDVKPYLLAPALTMIVAQRLVRKLCSHCQTRRPPTETERGILRQREDSLWWGRTIPPSCTVPTAWGCPHCQWLGYKSRVAIHEVLDIGKDIKDAIAAGGTDDTIHSLAKKTPWYRPMLHDGLEKMMQWQTSLDEIQRVLV